MYVHDFTNTDVFLAYLNALVWLLITFVLYGDLKHSLRNLPDSYGSVIPLVTLAISFTVWLIIFGPTDGTFIRLLGDLVDTHLYALSVVTALFFGGLIWATFGFKCLNDYPTGMAIVLLVVSFVTLLTIKSAFISSGRSLPPDIIDAWQSLIRFATISTLVSVLTVYLRNARRILRTTRNSESA